MSARRKRAIQSLWDAKEEPMPPAEISGKIPWRGKELHSSYPRGSSPKWSNSEASDAFMSDDFDRRPSWEPSQRNGNMTKDNDINRDRYRMQTDPDFDEWESHYGTRPSDDDYGPPHRGRDRGVGGIGSMSRERGRSRSRSYSPKRSRSRSRGRASARDMARSRSRSRGRDRGRTWESARARSRSPFCDDRQESHEYADVRSDSRVSSRPCKDFVAGSCRRGSQCRFFHPEIPHSRVGNRQDDDLTERWSSRSEYSYGSRYSDKRNSADCARDRGFDGYMKDSGHDEEARDTIKDPYLCKDFMKGRCHRGVSCRFPHHVGSGDNHHRGDRDMYDDQDRRRQLNRNSRVPCKFFAVGKCTRDDCKFSHEAPESGGYDGRSHDNIRGSNLGDKNRKWNDRQPRDDLKADFAKSSRTFDDKNKSWNSPSWDDVEAGGFDGMLRDNIRGHTLDDMRKWDGRPRRNASGFSDVAKSNLTSDDKKKSWDGPSWEEAYSDVEKSNHNIDDKNPWDGPSWRVASASNFPGNAEPSNNSEDKKSPLDGTSRDNIGAPILSDDQNSNNTKDGKRNPWNGPSWDEVIPSGCSDIAKSGEQAGGSVGVLHTDSKSRKQDAPGWNEKVSEKNDYLLSQQVSVTNDMDMASNQSRGADNLEPQLVSDSTPSHTLDAQAQHRIPEASGSQQGNPTTARRLEGHGSFYLQHHQRQGEGNVAIMIDDSDAHNEDMVSKNANQQAVTYGKDFMKGSMGCQTPNLSGNEASRLTPSTNPTDEPKIQLNGLGQSMFLHLDSQKQTEIHNREGGKPLEDVEIGVPQMMHNMNTTAISNDQFPQRISLPSSLPQIPQKGQPPQSYAEPNVSSAMGLLYSIPGSASSGPPVDPIVVQHDQDSRPKGQYEPARDMEGSKSVKPSVPMGILSSSVGQETQMHEERFSPISTSDPYTSKLGAIDVPKDENGKTPKTMKQESFEKREDKEKIIGDNPKHEQGKSEAQGKGEEGNASNDEKAMRQFKIALVEFVKEILKPKWKEGKMSREVHKTVVKKVVDKVTCSIQGIQIPRAQEKIDQYLAFSKPKISKLVEAYVERFLKG